MENESHQQQGDNRKTANRAGEKAFNIWMSDANEE